MKKHLAIIISLVVFVTLGITVTDAWYHPTPTPFNICDYQDGITIEGNNPCITPSPTVSPTPEVTATPSATEAPTAPPAGHGDGRSDGRSDGMHTAPDGLGCAVHECKVMVPELAPSTGRG